MAARPQHERLAAEELKSRKVNGRDGQKISNYSAQ
jgi:hypothetical protein